MTTETTPIQPTTREGTSMTMPTPSIAIPRAPRRPGRRTFIGLAVGAALAVAAGVGLWEANRGGDSTTAGEQAPSAAMVAPAARVAPVDTILTVNIVGTEEAKLRLEQGLDEGSAIRDLQGERPLENHVVLVAATDEEANRIVQAYSDHQDGLGQPVKFNDFRTRAAAPAAPPVSDQEMYQRWLQTGARPPQPAGAALRQAADDTTTCGTRAAETAC